MIPADPGPRYVLLGTLGEGNFGAVYRALDRELTREVALKRALPQADEAPGWQAQSFMKEAGVLQGLRHSGICQVLDKFTRGDEAWLSLELIAGESLEERVRRAGPLDEAALVDLMRKCLEPLVYLHSQTPPVVHRDLKPANLRLTPEGRAVLVDFGLARGRQRGQRDTELLGTPGYAAPEQCGGHSEPATDVFAWAGTMFFAATGVEPSQDARPFPPLRQFRPGFSTWIERLLEACIRFEPDQRPTSRQALDCVVQKRPPATLRPPVVAQDLQTRGPGGGRTVVLGSCPHCRVQEDPVQGCCPACQLGAELSGQPAGAFLDRAEGLLRSQRTEAALAHLDRAARMGSQDPRIPLIRTRILLALGNPERALQALSSCPPSAEASVEKARALLRQGRCAEAKEELGGLPGPEAALLRAMCEPPEVQAQALRAGAASYPDHPGFARVQAHLLAAQGRKAEAIALLEQPVTAGSEDEGLLRQLVRLLQECGRHADSLVPLRRWSRLLPDDPETRRLMSRVHASQGRAADARKALLEYLQLRPGAHEVRLELAHLLINDSGRPEEALPLLSELEELPEWKGQVTACRGLALSRCGRHREAEEVLRPMAPSSRDADFVAQYAHVVAALGHADLARQWARRALELDGRCAKARELLAR